MKDWVCKNHWFEYISSFKSFVMLTNKKTLTQQDDCAPDSLEYFDKRFEQILGCTRQEFQDKAVYTQVGAGYSHYWRFENYNLEIHADDPYYKLSIEE